MAVSIPMSLVEFIMLGPLDDRRQLQDSPILGDVWVKFGEQPTEPLDLLITPYRGQPAGEVAAVIDTGLDSNDETVSVAYLQGLVVARLSFADLLRLVIPRTQWWIRKKTPAKLPQPVQKKGRKRTAPAGKSPTASLPPYELAPFSNVQYAKQVVGDVLGMARDWNARTTNRRIQELPSLHRFITLAGLILWAADHAPLSSSAGGSPTERVHYILEHATAHDVSEQIADPLTLSSQSASDGHDIPLVHQVSLNRTATPALVRSIPAVKADAVRRLFETSCKDIAWAILDSGIGSHPALCDEGGRSRVKRSFDFRNLRRIVNLGNSRTKVRERNLAALEEHREARLNRPDNPDDALLLLAQDAQGRGAVRWELVEPFVEIKPGIKPPTNHGTHVAGILAANKVAVLKALKRAGEQELSNEDVADGMCPDISLYDFRVLGADLQDTEFAIIAALQFIRYLNSRDNFLAIHGANLSLSIPHDVRNYACGQTPICDECERLVDSGVVVVAAAGNHGYKSFETKDGAFESYAAFSITDPGNADGVITVGSTHRFWPHTYGVSFFSSRGPTGDGRIKPDIVAPGERIRAPVPSDVALPFGEWADLDGTSMAAPHVSGAAALLMARYSELIGRPQRIKEILCKSATDLGRERSFQGCGMLDVLRAFQSI